MEQADLKRQKLLESSFFLTYFQADWNCTSQSQSYSQDF